MQIPLGTPFSTGVSYAFAIVAIDDEGQVNQEVRDSIVRVLSFVAI